MHSLVHVQESQIRRPQGPTASCGPKVPMPLPVQTSAGPETTWYLSRGQMGRRSQPGLGLHGWGRVGRGASRVEEQGARGKVACTIPRMWPPQCFFFFSFCLLTSLLKAPAPVYNPYCSEKGPRRPCSVPHLKGRAYRGFAVPRLLLGKRGWGV